MDSRFRGNDCASKAIPQSQMTPPPTAQSVSRSTRPFGPGRSLQALANHLANRPWREPRPEGAKKGGFKIKPGMSLIINALSVASHTTLLRNWTAPIRGAGPPARPDRSWPHHSGPLRHAEGTLSPHKGERGAGSVGIAACKEVLDKDQTSTYTGV